MARWMIGVPAGGPVGVIQQYVPVLSVGAVPPGHSHHVRRDRGQGGLLGEHEVARIDQPDLVNVPVLHAAGFDDVQRWPVLRVGVQGDEDQHDDREGHKRFEEDRVAGPGSRSVRALPWGDATAACRARASRRRPPRGPPPRPPPRRATAWGERDDGGGTLFAGERVWVTPPRPLRRPRQDRRPGDPADASPPGLRFGP